ncbi:MAG: hypothetical protein GX020_03045 [Firmicutes bacterium]|jgi:hypothetical protein|nr:hypothetical protein [Bacillota bacterium]
MNFQWHHTFCYWLILTIVGFGLFLNFFFAISRPNGSNHMFLPEFGHRNLDTPIAGAVFGILVFGFGAILIKTSFGIGVFGSYDKNAR